MPKISLTVDKRAILGDQSTLLAGYSEKRKYENGKPTDEKDGFNVEVLKLAGGMSMLTVKVTTLDLDGMSKETIDQRNEAGEFIRVDFSDDFSARPYVDRAGSLAVTATASRVFLAETTSTGKSKGGAIPGIGGDSHA